MSPSQCFEIANTAALMGWVVLIVFPNSKLSLQFVRNGRLSLALALGYMAALAVSSGGLKDGSGFGSLAAVKTLFSNDWALLAGWIHYLAFDLLIGARVLVDGGSRSRWLTTLILILIFLFGPVGWFVSEITRSTVNKGASK